MSQSAAAVRTARPPSSTARPAARGQVPGRAPQAPRLRVVTAPRHTRSRAGLVAACVALLALGLVGLLLLDVSLERGTYELRDQNVRAEQLREQEQKLQQQIQDLTAPQNLAAQARRLGMVDAAGAPVFVLPNGRTVGVPQHAAAAPSPTVTAKPAQSRTPAAPHASATTAPTSKARPAPTVARPRATTPAPTHRH
jgi:cell division protein FtsB